MALEEAPLQKQMLWTADRSLLVHQQHLQKWSKQVCSFFKLDVFSACVE